MLQVSYVLLSQCPAVMTHSGLSRDPPQCPSWSPGMVMITWWRPSLSVQSRPIILFWMAPSVAPAQEGGREEEVPATINNLLIRNYITIKKLLYLFWLAGLCCMNVYGSMGRSIKLYHLVRKSFCNIIIEVVRCTVIWQLVLARSCCEICFYIFIGFLTWNT